MSNLKAYILCRFARTSGIYANWMDKIPIPASVIDEYSPSWRVPDDAAILITHMHYRLEELATLRKIVEQNRIPVLILADGILEYRNTWEHPDLADGSIFQPLFGHKLACIGRGQARVVESWGNGGRCEVVGLPRLDQVDAKSLPSVNRTGAFRVLIATANTPAFDQRQRETVIDSLKHMKQWVESNTTVNDRPLEVNWRLSNGLESEIGVGGDVDPKTRRSIGNEIEMVDAVITTPSTMYLESVLRGRPTALLDFHNSPHYVTAAWTINVPQQLGRVMSELAAPAPDKMTFQEFVLHDQLECRTPATPRMLDLVGQMVDAGVMARARKQPVMLPARMLADERSGFSLVPEGFDLSKLYPEKELFQNQDVQRLQIELVAAIQRLEQLPLELAEKNRYIAKLRQSLDRSRDRMVEMHNQIVAMRERFGVEPSKPRINRCDLVDED